MKDLLLLFLAFACGGFCGFIAASFFAAGTRSDELDDFDGGFSLSNQPPVRTRIWGGRVDDHRE